jgi:hypothetical protein
VKNIDMVCKSHTKTCSKLWTSIPSSFPTRDIFQTTTTTVDQRRGAPNGVALAPLKAPPKPPLPDIDPNPLPDIDPNPVVPPPKGEAEAPDAAKEPNVATWPPPNVLPPEGEPNVLGGCPEPKLDPKPELALPLKGVVWPKPPCMPPGPADPKPLRCGFEGSPNTSGSKLYFFARFLNKCSSSFLYFVNTLSIS